MIIPSATHHLSLIRMQSTGQKLPVSLKRLNETKNVSQQTPPKMVETIWVKPLFQWFQPDSDIIPGLVVK